MMSYCIHTAGTTCGIQTEQNGNGTPCSFYEFNWKLKAPPPCLLWNSTTVWERCGGVMWVFPESPAEPHPYTSLSVGSATIWPPPSIRWPHHAHGQLLQWELITITCHRPATACSNRCSLLRSPHLHATPPPPSFMPGQFGPIPRC